MIRALIAVILAVAEVALLAWDIQHHTSAHTPLIVALGAVLVASMAWRRRKGRRP